MHSSSPGDGRSVEQLSVSVANSVRYVGLIALAIGVATSSLTISWVIQHNAEAGIYPEFAGRVIYISDVWVFVGFAAWMTGWYLGPPRPLRLGPSYVFVPLLLIVVLSVLSTVWAGDGAIATVAAVRRLWFFGLYVALVNDVRQALVPVIAALFGFAFLQATVAWAQVIEGGAVGLTTLGEIAPDAFNYVDVGCPRPVGLGFSSNPLGLFLAVVSTTAYGLFLMADSRWPVRTLMLVPFQVAFLALAVTLSRSALVGCVLGLLVVTLLAWLWNVDARTVTVRRFGVVAVLVVGTLWLFPTILPAAPDCERESRYSQESILLRVTLTGRDFRRTLPVIRENLWLGVGAANLPYVLKQRVNSSFESVTPVSFTPVSFTPVPFTPVHNVPLLLFAELGILGGGAWLMIMSAPLIWIHSRRHAVGIDMHELLWLGAVLPLLFIGFFDFTPWATQDGRVLMMAALGLWAGAVSQASLGSQEDRGVGRLRR